MKTCPECGGELKRMYSKEYLDEHFPVNSPQDKMNMEIHISSKRLYKCINCDHIELISKLRLYLMAIKKMWWF